MLSDWHMTRRDTLNPKPQILIPTLNPEPQAADPGIILYVPATHAVHAPPSDP